MAQTPDAQTPGSPDAGGDTPNPRRMGQRPAAPSAAAKGAQKGGNKKGVPLVEPVPSGLGTVVVRNEFYRDGYRSLLRLALVQGVVIVGLILAMFFVVHTHQPENRYFATTEDGRLVPMVPLNAPNLSAPALMSWVAQAATEVMTFGFSDYRRRLQEASRNFTRRGWDSFTQALERSRIIETVTEYQQVITAAPRGAPILLSEGLVNGRYQWQVQLPMILTYQAGSRVRSDSWMVTMVIVRVSRLESANGVGIEQWIAQPGGG